jgi:sugar/nucleoside kinase (ribokinase family)
MPVLRLRSPWPFAGKQADPVADTRPNLVSRGHVLVVGDVMEDIIAIPEGPIVRGSDRRAVIRRCPGGSGANQATWLGFFKVPVTFAGRVGTADLVRYWTHFSRAGVSPALVGDDERPTGALVTLVDGRAERSFLTDRGANLGLCEKDLPISLLRECALLVVSGYSLFEAGPRRAILGLIEHARRTGIRFAVDPASTAFLTEMGALAFLEAIQGARILFPNAEEAEMLTGSHDLDEQLDVLCRYADLVVLKRGAAGAMLASADGARFALPAPAILPVDTTGAGDAFLARFVTEWLARTDLEKCLALAIATGSAATGRIGGQPGQFDNKRSDLA